MTYGIWSVVFEVVIFRELKDVTDRRKREKLCIILHSLLRRLRGLLRGLRVRDPEDPTLAGIGLGEFLPGVYQGVLPVGVQYILDFVREVFGTFFTDGQYHDRLLRGFCDVVQEKSQL